MDRKASRCPSTDEHIADSVADFSCMRRERGFPENSRIQWAFYVSLLLKLLCDSQVRQWDSLTTQLIAFDSQPGNIQCSKYLWN